MPPPRSLCRKAPFVQRNGTSGQQGQGVLLNSDLRSHSSVIWRLGEFVKWKWFPELCLSVLSYFSLVSAAASPLPVGNAHRTFIPLPNFIPVWQTDKSSQRHQVSTFFFFFYENGGWAGKRHPHPHPPRRNVGRVSLTFVCLARQSADAELGSSHTQAASRSSRCEGQRSKREESQGRGRWIIKELGEKCRMLSWEEWRHAMRILRKQGFVFSDGCMEQLVFLRRRGVTEQGKEAGMASGS